MIRVAAVVLLFALVAAGCGSTTDATPRSQTVSAGGAQPVAFAQRAQAVCADMQVDAERMTSGGKPTDAEIRRVVSSWRTSLDELGALEPPSAAAPEYRKMIAAYRTTLDAIAAMVEAEDESVLGAIAGVSLFGHRGARAARRASLPECALFPEITQPPTDPEPIPDATTALVPDGVEIVRAVEDDCGARDSCRVEYRGVGAVDARLRAARELLGARGWTNLRSGRTPGIGAAWVMANRNDYAATVELVSGQLPAHCATTRVTWGCVDSVWVHRIEVPEAFLADD